MAELGRINVFYSYAHEDEQYRDQLVECLAELGEEGVINTWHDRMITPASDWKREIERNLDRAHIVLFLISPDFMASEYCVGVEVERAVELHWQRQCRIVPVLVRPTREWTSTTFGSFQALPRDAKPVAAWARPEAAYADISEGIRKVCKEIVDWQNPLRRANVGDWVEREQTLIADGQRHVSRMRAVITAKNDDFATLTATADVSGQKFRIPVQLSLDRPAEDSFGEVMKQLGEQIPPNAQYYREETGRGEQKLFVGGQPYYCQWASSSATWEDGDTRVVATEKTWRCIDVPVDGVVKEEFLCRTGSGQEIFRKNTVLLAHGRGGDRKRDALRRPTTPPLDQQLLEASTKGQVDVPRIKALLASGASVEARDESGYTPLIRAAEAGHSFALRVLLNAGAEVNATADDGATALIAAAASSANLQTMKTLLQSGADANAGTDDGSTALSHATNRGDQKTVALLLEHGATPQPKPRKQR